MSAPAPLPSPQDFTPAVRHAAHALDAYGRAMPAAALAARIGCPRAELAPLVARVQAALAATGAEVREEPGEDPSYSLAVPDRHAFERLVGAPPTGHAKHPPFRQFVGLKALALRTLVEAEGRPVTAGVLARALYGEDTVRARSRAGYTLKDVEGILRTTGNAGTVIRTGTGLDRAYRWEPNRVITPGERPAPGRVKHITLAPCGCESWLVLPGTTARGPVHIAKLRGEEQPRVLTHEARGRAKDATVFTAPFGTVPADESED